MAELEKLCRSIMKQLFIIPMTFLIISSPAVAAWFQVQAKDFPRIEMLANKQIVLYRPLNQPGLSISSFYPTGSQGESGIVDQFTFTPPVGVESQFLSILLSALATKGTFLVEGHLGSNTTVITSSRVQIQ